MPAVLVVRKSSVCMLRDILNTLRVYIEYSYLLVMCIGKKVREILSKEKPHVPLSQACTEL